MDRLEELQRACILVILVELWAQAHGYTIICEDGVGFLVYDSVGAFVGHL